MATGLERLHVAPVLIIKRLPSSLQSELSTAGEARRGLCSTRAGPLLDGAITQKLQAVEGPALTQKPRSYVGMKQPLSYSQYEGVPG